MRKYISSSMMVFKIKFSEEKIRCCSRTLVLFLHVPVGHCLHDCVYATSQDDSEEEGCVKNISSSMIFLKLSLVE